MVAALPCALSPNFKKVIGVGFLEGIGAASTKVIATSIVRDRYAGREMAEVMPMVFMLFMAIPILAPGGGELLMYAWTWQAIFDS